MIEIEFEYMHCIILKYIISINVFETYTEKYNKLYWILSEDNAYNLIDRIKDKFIKVIKEKKLNSVNENMNDLEEKAFDILIEVKRKINMLEIDCGVLSFIQIQRVHGLENDDLIELDEVYNEYLLLK